jgi:signal transduction histidine kinase
MLECGEQELVGQSIFKYTHAEEAVQESEFFAQLKRTGSAFEIEKRIVRKNGTLLWVNQSLSGIRDKNGDLESAVAVILDITGRKALEQQKDEFIAVASHELKTPVTSIKGYADILQDRFEKANETENTRLMQRLNKQVDRLATFIKDLLDTTKIVEGKLPLDITRFDLNELIAERVDELKRLSAKHDIVFRQRSDRGEIAADKERIEQVLTNLIINAIKYSPDGGDITIKTEDTKYALKVSVQDKGIGIPEEMQPKVFDRFFRVGRPHAESFSGMGLGLYISAGIIQRHGGTINVESKPGKGSTFYFIIPYQETK